MKAADADLRGRVLVADDSAVVRNVVGSYLRRAGFAVNEAANGAIALRLLSAGNFDVVITDLKMPEMDGLEVLAAVKERALGTEVVILTGTRDDFSTALKALRLGAHDFLVKPPESAEQVVLTVDRAIEKKRLRDANSRLLRELELLSRQDSLTGASNRRAFDEMLAREVARARRHGFPLSVLLLDVDHFKKVNDNHGHAAGDQALRAIVRIAQESLRENEGVFRHGGEEFSALLPNTGLMGAFAAAQRLIAHVARTPIDVGGHVLRLTCSVGVANLEGVETGAELVARADGALYDAKRAGRNRVGASHMPPPAIALAQRELSATRH
jgi:diguanylate cyclase (GGDEF)-like protein